MQNVVGSNVGNTGLVPDGVPLIATGPVTPDCQPIRSKRGSAVEASSVTEPTVLVIGEPLRMISAAATCTIMFGEPDCVTVPPETTPVLPYPRAQIGKRRVREA